MFKLRWINFFECFTSMHFAIVLYSFEDILKKYVFKIYFKLFSKPSSTWILMLKPNMTKSN